MKDTFTNWPRDYANSHHDNITIIKPPLFSKWSWSIGSNFSVRLFKGEEPNWFHRKMQTLVLGIKWVKS